MIKKLLIVGALIITLVLAAMKLGFVNFNISLTERGEEINSSILKEVDLNSKAVLSLIESNKVLELKKLFIEKVSSQPNFEKNLSPVVAFTRGLIGVSSDVKIYEDYYHRGKTSTIKSETDPEFFINIQPSSDETFVRLYSISLSEYENWILSIVWSKQGDSWQIEHLYTGLNKYQSRDQFAWFEESEKYYDKKDYVGSLLYLNAGYKAMKPMAIANWPKATEKYEELYKKLKKHINSNLPLKLESTKSEVKIYNITAELIKNEFYEAITQIKYSTKIGISSENGALLKAEAEVIKAEIIKKYPILEKFSEKINFVAFGEAPIDPKKQYVTYKNRL